MSILAKSVAGAVVLGATLAGAHVNAATASSFVKVTYHVTPRAGFNTPGGGLALSQQQNRIWARSIAASAWKRDDERRNLDSAGTGGSTLYAVSRQTEGEDTVQVYLIRVPSNLW